MKRFKLYYFSGTGNTWWVADRLARILRENGHEVQMQSIETVTREEVSEQIEHADHILIGFPVVGSTAHKNVLQFMETFPASNAHQPVSVFATHALASGDTAWFIGKKLEKRGYPLKQAAHFRMMNNFHIPKFKFVKPKNDERLDKLLKQTAVKVEAFAKSILEGKTKITGNHPAGHLLGGFQRSAVNALERLIAKDFRVEPSRCIHCGKCVRICPVGNIKEDGGTYRFEEHCIVCMRCYSQCPKSAILIGDGSMDEEKYPRFRGPGKNFRIEVVRDGCSRANPH